MIGLDAKIESLRAKFASDLYSSTSYSAKGRAFWNEKGEENIPELYLDDGKNYEETLLNTKIDGHSFFLVDPEIGVLSKSDRKADVGIYFAVNLAKLYPNVTERAVEYIHRDVTKILMNYPFKLKEDGGIITGLKAFEDFGFVKDSDNMHPFYLVRFNTEIEYKQNCTN